jgi:hypothetical protein
MPVLAAEKILLLRRLATARLPLRDLVVMGQVGTKVDPLHRPLRLPLLPLEVQGVLVEPHPLLDLVVRVEVVANQCAIPVIRCCMVVAKPCPYLRTTPVQEQRTATLPCFNAG